MKIFLIRACITAAVLGLTLVLFEIYLRKETTYVVRREIAQSRGLIEMNPELLIEYTPQGQRRLVPKASVVIRNHFISKRDIAVSTNSLGFRDEEIPDQKAPNEIRILALGDSITVGDYLNADEVFVKRAEKYLAAEFPQKGIRMINAGMSNFSLEDERKLLEDRGIKSQPDVVLQAFYLNDSRPPWGFSGEIGDRGWLRKYSLLAETLYRSFRQRKWEKDAPQFAWLGAEKKLNWAADHGDFLKLAELARYDWGAAWQQNSWPGVERELARIKSLSDLHRFKVAVTALPVSFQVYAEFVDDTPQRQLRGLAHNFGFYYLDILPVLRANRDKDLFFDQCHPRETANDIIGKEIAEFLRREVLHDL